MFLRTENPSLPCSFRSKNFVGKKNSQIQGKSAVYPAGLTSILTQYMGIFLRQNRVRMCALWLTIAYICNIDSICNIRRQKPLPNYPTAILQSKSFLFPFLFCLIPAIIPQISLLLKTLKSGLAKGLINPHRYRI